MSNLTPLSRKLRNNLTDAERKLWFRLRRKQLNGYKFRRQVPIEHYIVDFLCYERRLIIELDGGQHFDNKDKDDLRTKRLEEFGFIVKRYWNNDVINNMDGVLEDIIDALDKS